MILGFFVAFLAPFHFFFLLLLLKLLAIDYVKLAPIPLKSKIFTWLCFANSKSVRLNFCGRFCFCFHLLFQFIGLFHDSYNFLV